MVRVGKVDRNSLPVEFQERFDIIEKSNGYIPNSYLVLGHRPPVLKAFMTFQRRLFATRVRSIVVSAFSSPIFPHRPRGASSVRRTTSRALRVGVFLTTS